MSDPANVSNIAIGRCSVDGCDKSPCCRSMCSAHYYRWLRHGSPFGGGRFRRPPNLSKQDVVAKELREARRDGACLLTQAYIMSSGYGQVRNGNSAVLLHRMVLEVSIGRTLGNDELACHTCHRRNCINPKHLYVGTVQTNADDMVRAGRSAKGSLHGMSKLTEPAVLDIRKAADAGESTTSIATRLSVSVRTVQRVVRRDIWTHV